MTQARTLLGDRFQTESQKLAKKVRGLPLQQQVLFFAIARLSAATHAGYSASPARSVPPPLLSSNVIVSKLHHSLRLYAISSLQTNCLSILKHSSSSQKVYTKLAGHVGLPASLSYGEFLTCASTLSLSGIVSLSLCSNDIAPSLSAEGPPLSPIRHPKSPLTRSVQGSRTPTVQRTPVTHNTPRKAPSRVPTRTPTRTPIRVRTPVQTRNGNEDKCLLKLHLSREEIRFVVRHLRKENGIFKILHQNEGSESEESD